MSRLRHLRINPCFVISFFSPNVFWCSWEAVAAQFWCGRWPGPSWALDDQHLHPCESVRLSYQCGRNQGPTFFQTLSFMDVDGWNMLELGSRGIGDPLVVWVISSAQVFRCCQALVAALKSNETVVDINLASNYLGDKGAEACIVGTLWHLEKNMGTDWFEMSPVWSHVARMAAVSADVLQVKLGWFDFDWTLMTLDVAFWCILMHVDIFNILIMFVFCCRSLQLFSTRTQPSDFWTWRRVSSRTLGWRRGVSCIYQKGMGKPGEADRNGPGWVWLPPCVVTLTPPKALVPHVSWHGEFHICFKSMSDHIS